ncbi:hypothetical protein FB45DRAFT_1080156 [Roridomyces roridus]|uniref:CENP-V/GFA domain-containing protein n=1 Tax=Roridomyces roridus TaxID=1738132 RepID=A0AAD7BRT2_9AGAR|nr:hypothetical protein FB45DRAFT_1080156 [Roridomyces roridus]
MSTPFLVEYKGNCHCKAFKFIFKAPEIKQTFVCACSICYKNGYLWGFPSEGVVDVVKGGTESTLKSYQFGNCTHKFCPTCGTSVLAHLANGTIAINLRTLHEFDATALPEVARDNGANEPAYRVPEPLDVGPVPKGTIVYQGSCHCGAVRYAQLASEPLQEAKECNCSICHRDAALWVYPGTPTVIFAGLTSLTEYTFGLGRTYHGFCGSCGVSIRERFVNTKLEGFEGRDRTRKVALNVRTMSGVDLGELTIKKHDGRLGSKAGPYDAGW